jgi:hypothetical protein
MSKIYCLTSIPMNLEVAVARAVFVPENKIDNLLKDFQV